VKKYVTIYISKILGGIFMDIRKQINDKIVDLSTAIEIDDFNSTIKLVEELNELALQLENIREVHALSNLFSPYTFYKINNSLIYTTINLNSEFISKNIFYVFHLFLSD
jgi:hypothetical protein